MSGEHAVSIRLPAWFQSDGFTLTLEQLQQPDYVLDVFVPEFLAFFRASPEELEVRVDGGRWRRVGRPIEALPAPARRAASGQRVSAALALEGVPEGVNRVWACGLPLEGFPSAPECAEEHAPGVPDAVRPVIAALHQLLSDGRLRSQRAVLRDIAGQFTVMEIKAALRTGVEQERFSRTDGPRRAHLYGVHVDGPR